MEGNILKTLVFFSDDQKGMIYWADTIQYGGRTWLVPGWLDNPKEGYRIPERIICMDVLRYEKTSWNRADFVLTSGIPKSVFDGQLPPELKDKYIIIEKPDIRIPSIGG